MKLALFVFLVGAALALDAVASTEASAVTEKGRGIGRFNRNREEHAENRRGGFAGRRGEQQDGEKKEDEQKEGEQKGEKKPCPKSHHKGAFKHSPNSVIHKVVYDTIFESGLIDRLAHKLAFFSAAHGRHFEKKENKGHKLRKPFGKKEEETKEVETKEEVEETSEETEETAAPERIPEPVAEIKAADVASTAPEIVTSAPEAAVEVVAAVEVATDAAPAEAEAAPAASEAPAAPEAAAVDAASAAPEAVATEAAPAATVSA